MTDEEKKAINQLKADTSFYDYELKNGNYIYELFKIEVYKKDIDVILNLIEKQSKEIEELKDKCKELIFEKQELTSALLDSTPNDKIKATIEELDENGYWDFLEKRDEEKCKDILQSLLEKE